MLPSQRAKTLRKKNYKNKKKKKKKRKKEEEERKHKIVPKQQLFFFFFYLRLSCIGPSSHRGCSQRFRLSTMARSPYTFETSILNLYGQDK